MSISKKAFNGVIKILNDGRGLINHINNKTKQGYNLRFYV